MISNHGDMGTPTYIFMVWYSLVCLLLTFCLTFSGHTKVKYVISEIGLLQKKIFDGCHKKKRLIWWAYFKSSTYHAHAFSQERCLAIKRIIQSFSVDYYIMYSRHFFEDLTVDEAVQQNANDAGGTCTRLRGGGCYEN